MHPLNAVANHTDVTDAYAILEGHIFDGHRLPVYTHLANRVFSEFALPVIASGWRFSSKKVERMSRIVSLRKVLKIAGAVIGLYPVDMVYSHLMSARANKRRCNDTVNLLPQLRFVVLKVESPVSLTYLLREDHAFAVAKPSKIGDFIDSLIANYRNPVFFHDFNYIRSLG